MFRRGWPRWVSLHSGSLTHSLFLLLIPNVCTESRDSSSQYASTDPPAQAEPGWLEDKTTLSVLHFKQSSPSLWPLQPRWRLAAITRWWGWCPVETISTASPFSTDYWNTMTSCRPERTVWITSALWNEISHTYTLSQTHTLIHLCKYTSATNAIINILYCFFFFLLLLLAKCFAEWKLWCFAIYFKELF